MRELVLSGETDLSGLNLTDFDVSGSNLSRRNFRKSHLGFVAERCSFEECVFDSTTLAGRYSSADFSGCELRLVQFRGRFDRANFRNAKFIGGRFARADFRNADFRGAVFQRTKLPVTKRSLEESNFDGAIIDELTRFENMQISRDEALHPIFRFYEYQFGMLVRRDGQPEITSAGKSSAAETSDRATPSEFSDSESPASTRRIAARIQSEAGGIALLAASLASSISEELERLRSTMPNDPLQLAQRQSYVDLLTRLNAQLEQLSREIDAVMSKVSSNAGAFESAAVTAQRMKGDFARWVDENLTETLDAGIRVGLIGSACAFLYYCHVPVSYGGAASIALFGGGPLVEKIKTIIKAFKE